MKLSKKIAVITGAGRGIGESIAHAFADEGADLILTFSDLDPEKEYEVVLFGNRDKAAYSNRVTRFIISGHDEFQNKSTSGAVFSGPADTSTVIVNGNNTTDGYVARFSKVEPGSDGSFTITVTDGGSAIPPKFYVNALMLKGFAAGGLHGGKPILQDRSQDRDHLSVAVIGAAQLAPHLFQR